MPTLERWSDLSIRLGATSSMVVTFQEVIAAYSESTRAYHTVAHLDECLREFDLATHLAEHPEEVEAGIWFHDAVYDTHRHDNEERAANWAALSLSAAGVSESVASRVATLVLATSHVAPPVENDAGLLVDVDLSVLGREPAAFDEYEHQIRVEYSWVPDEAFRSGRANLLESLLRRPRIYHTESFGARYESRARANLKRSLERLRAKAS